MQRFFFHVFDEDTTLDEQGQMAADVAVARGVALASARELICEQVRSGHLNLQNYIMVTNEFGQEVFRVSYAEAVALHPEQESRS